MNNRTSTSVLAKAIKPKPNTEPRPVLTLHTFLISTTGNDNHSKFIHATSNLTLVDFLKLFRSKHKIDASLNLTDIELTLGDMVLGISLDDNDRDWDWEALMDNFGKTKGLVKAVVKAG